MAEITIKKHIKAPLEQVFDRPADFPNAAKTVSGIERVEMLTDGPVGVGTRFRETRKFYKREATEEMEVTAFERPRCYALGSESHGCRYHSELRFHAVDGGTDVEMRFQAEPLTGFAKVMSVLMRPMMKGVTKCLEQDLEDIKNALEH